MHVQERQVGHGAPLLGQCPADIVVSHGPTGGHGMPAHAHQRKQYMLCVDTNKTPTVYHHFTTTTPSKLLRMPIMGAIFGVTKQALAVVLP
jgi:hypothetical protein